MNYFYFQKKKKKKKKTKLKSNRWKRTQLADWNRHLVIVTIGEEFDSSKTES